MRRILKAVLTAIWFMALTLPVMGIKLNTLDQTVQWRFDRILWLGAGVFALAVIWDWCFSRKARGLPLLRLPEGWGAGLRNLSGRPHLKTGGLAILTLFMLVMPLTSSFYQTNIMISALLYVMLALGLNIVVGLAGQLVLGYVAFYAVALQNWTSLTGGPRGISDIPRPGFFGLEMDINASTTYVYYLVLAAVVITIIMISRLKNSRVGLALQALREDEIACEAMGIDITRVKLSAFALGSCWAGFAGVIFAAKTTYINPSSFTFMESAMILSMVVLGGMGSIAGVVIAAMILILAPEYLRAFSEYRMLIFGAIMVIMMIFRPQGLISGERRRYRISALHGAHNGGRA